jgi:hypothetical protein
MPDLTNTLQILTLILVSVGGFLLVLLKTSAKTAVETATKEGVKAAMRDLEWSAQLARTLEKTRGVERQELRFRCYGALWKELRPLAIYDPTHITKQSVGELADKLTNWYFSQYGGLLLTPHARSFYFAVQDLLRTTSNIPDDWSIERHKISERHIGQAFRDLLQKSAPTGTKVFDYFKDGHFEEWQHKAVELGEIWRDAIEKLAGSWKNLTDRERFIILQQVGSKLRTSLTNDLESRLG